MFQVLILELPLDVSTREMVVLLPISLIIIQKTYSLLSTIMESIFLYVLWRSLPVTVVILAVFALRYLFAKRLSPTARHALWFFLLPVMLLPMSIVPISVPTANQPIQEASPTPIPSARMDGPQSGMSFDLSPKMLEEPSESRIRTVAPPLLHVESTAETPIKTQRPSVSLSLFFLSAILWGLGIVVLSGLSIVQVFHYRHRFAKASPITDGNTLALLDHCRNDLKIKMPVRLLESRRLLFPVLAGIGNPRVILPIGFIGRYSDEQLTHFLRHELAHLKRRDIVTGWLMSLFCIVHWFNPLVWIAIRTMNSDVEEAADQLATKTFDKTRRIEYGLTLLALSERLDEIPKRILLPLSESVPGVAGLMESSTQLSRRIEMLKQRETWHRGWMFSAFVLCLIVSTATLTRFQFVVAQTVEASKKSVAESQTEDKEQPDPTNHDSPIANEKTSTPDSREVARKESGLLAPVQDRKKVKVACRVLKPNGEVADGIVFQFNDYPNGGTISSGGGIPRDGIFDVDLYADRSYTGVVFDKFNRFAAPLQRFTTGDKASDGEIVFQLEDGVPLRASFIDETTNKPISGLKIYLAWEAEISERGHWIMFEKTSDKNGLFEAHVMPGKYVLSIDQHFMYPNVVQKGVYARNVVVEDQNLVDLEFRIPTPFTGKVVNIDGTPARNRLVFVTPSNLGQEGSQGFTVAETDQNGVFRRIEPPVNASVSVLPGGGFMGLGIGQYFAWFGDELAGMKEKEFRLVKEVVVSGRLQDAKTQKPLANQLFFHWKKNPKDLKQQAFMPEYSQTDGQGRFRIRLNPMLAYELFVVYGRQARHGGGPYYPRIALTTLEPELLDSQNIVDLGDLQVDSAKLIADPHGNLQEIAKKLQVQKQRVERGEKKALLRITVKDGAEESWKYIETHQDGEPLSSFAVLLVRYEDLPEEFRRKMENSDDEKVKDSNQERVIATFMDFRGENTSDKPFPPQITLSELRGEKDSPWNVPKDDPSNEGDWKKTPGMVNPKILDNFLNDYLEKLEKQGEPKGGVVPDRRSERRILDKSDSPFWLVAKESTTFGAVMKRIHDETGIDISIDRAALKETGIEPKTPVRFRPG